MSTAIHIYIEMEVRCTKGRNYRLNRSNIPNKTRPPRFVKLEFRVYTKTACAHTGYGINLYLSVIASWRQ